ncbi:hypothetical protein [Pontibacillus sp. HMF3514]|uniref:hypothetical protein n=1 Tax=Pontibacillus sp. HMF3514 TaxID=2692425 RepID=UPI00131F4DB3|nr:hypothetical protein [Pontibacillus sp. HMF3514]QHE50867.1 hypothetical protein GS400_01890 [Pontibacillus sp. HMF3514]
MNKFKSLIYLVLSTLIISLLPTTSFAEKSSRTSIYDYEQINKVFDVAYGAKDDQLGFTPNGTEGEIGTGVVSFYVQNNNVYFLDNVNKKVSVFDESGSFISSYDLSYARWLSDLIVLDNQTIYVLDSAKRFVYEINKDGEKVNSYDVPKEITIPTGLGKTINNKITVDQSQDIIVELKSGNKLGKSNLPNVEEKINENKGKITFNNGETIGDFTVNFEESYGGLTVNSIMPNRIIYTKTEVASHIPKIMAETHVYVANKKGETIGAVRIPLEEMYFAPRHLVRVDNNKIYLISPKENHLTLYELKPGKTFEKRLDDRINNFTKDMSNKVSSSKVSSTQTETNNDVSTQSNTGENGYLHRSDAGSRANSMINETWTVSSSNKSQASGTVLPDYVSNASSGSTLESIPYKWGGGDAHDIGAGSRNSFNYYQQNGYQTGDVDTNGYGVSSVTGLDCSGFVALAWYRSDKKYSTSSLYEITHNITKSDLKYMDALNDSGFHTLLYVNSGSNGIYTKEATTDGNQSAQDYSRTWYWLETSNDFIPVRYDRIADDGDPLPIY